MKVTFIPIVIDALGTVTKGLIQGLEDLEIKYHPKNCITEVGENIGKSPGDLRRLANYIENKIKIDEMKRNIIKELAKVTNTDMKDKSVL